MYIKHRNLLEN